MYDTSLLECYVYLSEYCMSIVRVLYVVDEDSFTDETLRFRGRRVGGAFKNLNFTSRASWGEIGARGGEHRQLEALSMKKSECGTFLCYFFDNAGQDNAIQQWFIHQQNSVKSLQLLPAA